MSISSTCMDCGTLANCFSGRCHYCIARIRMARAGSFSHPKYAATFDERNPPGAREALHRRIAEREALLRRYGVREDAATTADDEAD